MSSMEDQDRYFSGQIAASSPKHIMGEGVVSRLINARFVEGAITNAIAFDELELSLDTSINKKYPSASNITYNDLFNRGDIQLLAPLHNSWKYSAMSRSSRMNLKTQIHIQQ